MYNFADGKVTLYLSLQRPLQNQKRLYSLSRKLLSFGFKNNKIIVNPEKFQAIILDKQKHDYSNKTFKSDIKEQFLS